MQPHRLDRRTDLAGKRANKLQIGRLERVVPAAFGYPQPADRLAVMSEGLGMDTANRRTMFGSQRPSVRSIATYGSRSDWATVSTTTGSTSPGSMTACILVPSRAKTAAGSSRSPYISRFTVRCATLRTGARASSRA